MNQWVKRSLDLASQDGYLDKLHDVYSVSDVESRKIPDKISEDILRAHNVGNSFDLVSALLKLKKFPIDDIYVGYLRRDDDALNVNPRTVKRIGSRLLAMPVEDVIKLCKQPKVSNRQMGELFHQWFADLGYPRLDEDDFRRNQTHTGLDGKTHTILTMKGTRKEFRDFVNGKLGCGLEKELDIRVKVGGNTS